MRLLKKFLSFFFASSAEEGARHANDFFRSIVRSKQDVVMNGVTFYVDVEMASLYPELHTLVFNTESIDAGERQYWFDVMHTMTSAQIDELFDILETEKVKLGELETKFQEEMRKLNEKHLVEWQEFQANTHRGKICANCDDPINDDGRKECRSCDPTKDDVESAMRLIASL